MKALERERTRILYSERTHVIQHEYACKKHEREMEVQKLVLGKRDLAVELAARDLLIAKNKEELETRQAASALRISEQDAAFRAISPSVATCVARMAAAAVEVCTEAARIARDAVPCRALALKRHDCACTGAGGAGDIHTPLKPCNEFLPFASLHAIKLSSLLTEQQHADMHRFYVCSICADKNERKGKCIKVGGRGICMHCMQRARCAGEKKRGKGSGGGERVWVVGDGGGGGFLLVCQPRSFRVLFRGSPSCVCPVVSLSLHG